MQCESGSAKCTGLTLPYLRCAPVLPRHHRAAGFNPPVILMPKLHPRHDGRALVSFAAEAEFAAHAHYFPVLQMHFDEF